MSSYNRKPVIQAIYIGQVKYINWLSSFQLLQRMRWIISFLQLFEYEKFQKQRKTMDSVYYENARVLLHEEDIYRLKSSSSPSRLSVQLMDNVIGKPEAFAVSMEPNFSAFLHNDFLLVFPGNKEPHGIILKRNKNKYVSLDEFAATCMAMVGVELVNGLENKIACNPYKISYVLDTEDYFFRKRRNST